MTQKAQNGSYWRFANSIQPLPNLFPSAWHVPGTTNRLYGLGWDFHRYLLGRPPYLSLAMAVNGARVGQCVMMKPQTHHRQEQHVAQEPVQPPLQIGSHRTSYGHPMRLCQWIKRLCIDLALTQARLAEQASCAVQTIRAFEKGRRRPSRAFAARLATVLQVPPDQRAAFVRLAECAPTRLPVRSRWRRGDQQRTARPNRYRAAYEWAAREWAGSKRRASRSRAGSPPCHQAVCAVPPWCAIRVHRWRRGLLPRQSRRARESRPRWWLQEQC